MCAGKDFKPVKDAQDIISTVIQYNVWNKGLCTYTAQPVLVFNLRAEGIHYMHDETDKALS